MRKLPFLGVIAVLVTMAAPATMLGQSRLAASRLRTDAVSPRDELADRVFAAIRGYTPLTIFDDVGLAVSDRTVTLSGFVTDPFKRREIGDRVSRVEGVQTVTNEIRVLPVSRYDTDLRVKVAQAIYGHSAFWTYAALASPPIHVIVEGGRVTLTGRVQSEVERSLAEALAQVPGAFAVSNKLVVQK